MSAVVDQRFPFDERCHPKFLRSMMVRVVADPVRADSTCLLSCKFENCSKFWKKPLEDWHVRVQSDHEEAVVVVEMIGSPWRNDGDRPSV